MDAVGREFLLSVGLAVLLAAIPLAVFAKNVTGPRRRIALRGIAACFLVGIVAVGFLAYSSAQATGPLQGQLVDLLTKRGIPDAEVAMETREPCEEAKKPARTGPLGTFSLVEQMRACASKARTDTVTFVLTVKKEGCLDHEGRWDVALAKLNATTDRTFSLSCGTQPLALRDLGKLPREVPFSSAKNVAWELVSVKDAEVTGPNFSSRVLVAEVNVKNGSSSPVVLDFAGSSLAGKTKQGTVLSFSFDAKVTKSVSGQSARDSAVLTPGQSVSASIAFMSKHTDPSEITAIVGLSLLVKGKVEPPWFGRYLDPYKTWSTSEEFRVGPRAE